MPSTLVIPDGEVQGLDHLIEIRVRDTPRLDLLASAVTTDGSESAMTNSVRMMVTMTNPKIPEIHPRCAPFITDNRCPVLRR